MSSKLNSFIDFQNDINDSFFLIGRKVLKRLRYSFEIVALYCFLFGLFRLGSGPQTPAVFFLSNRDVQFKLKSVFKEIE